MDPRIEEIRRRLQAACDRLNRPVRIMEVCGTHTVAIFRHGIRSLLPANLKLLSGPGCPVCVTDQGYIDAALAIAQRPDCLIATYGDMVRVPGDQDSLETFAGAGRVRVVLSSDDALQLARTHPDKRVVFLAVGFETTTPATAVVAREALADGLENFYLLSSHKRVVPAMEALLSQKNDRIDGFLCPGHVSVILGARAYEPITRRFGRPCVVAGFEAVQILEALALIVEQLDAGRAEVVNHYGAVVTDEGNAAARALIDECFEPCTGWWRGIGPIPDSGLRLRPAYRRLDAYERFSVTEQSATAGPRGCRCGEVLCGLIDPADCPLFGRVCHPRDPVGPCMVSSEGACAAWYKYGGQTR